MTKKQEKVEKTKKEATKKETAKKTTQKTKGNKKNVERTILFAGIVLFGCFGNAVMIV